MSAYAGAGGKAGRYQVAVIDRDLAEEGLDGWWNGLPGPQATPVLRWEYLSTWARAFVPTGGRLQIHVVFHDGRPVAAVPLYRWRGVLHSLANDHSDLFDAAWEPGRDAAIDALAGTILRRRTALARLPAESPLLAAITRRRPPGATDCDDSPYIALPTSADELLAGRSSRYRANVRKAVRSLATLGDVSFTDVAGDSAEMANAYAALQQVEAASWKSAHGGSVDADAPSRRFYRDLALDGPASRWARVATLRVDDRVVAASLDLEHAGRRIGMRTSFVGDLGAKQSPGLVLLWLALSDEIARGVHTHEFGGDADAWKQHWTAQTRGRVTLRVWPATATGRLAHGTRQRVKPLVRSARGVFTGGP